VDIKPNTAWSCAHGVERWASNCGCSSGGNPGWHQRWRAPLRAALDLLRDRLAPLYEQATSTLLIDPWQARDAYVEVIFDGKQDVRDRFLRQVARRPLSSAEAAKVFQLLEMQRHLLLMYTSCGWFFDDISGPEPLQNLLYAARAMQLAQTALGVDVEPAFLDVLATAESNLADVGNGRKLYETQVRPRKVDLAKAFAHYAITSLFQSYEEPIRVYGYDVRSREHHALRSGRVSLAFGRAEISTAVTQESADLCFAVLHFGDHNLVGGVIPTKHDGFVLELRRALVEPFERADLPTVLRMVDRYFGSSSYTLRELFRDDQRRILDRLLRTTREEVEAELRKIYDAHAPLLRFLTDLHAPLPTALKTAAEQSLHIDLLRQLAAPSPDFAEIRRLFDEAQRSGVTLDENALSFALSQLLLRLGDKLREMPDSSKTLQALLDAVTLATTPSRKVDLWRTQNLFYELLQTVFADQLSRSQRSSDTMRTTKWLRLFGQLGDKLSIRLPASFAK
jgi:hypothetical protein